MQYKSVKTGKSWSKYQSLPDFDIMFERIERQTIA